MPTVPRNAPVDTRIDRTPGVRSVSPQGAEGLGAIAGALGRQAATVGAEARGMEQRNEAIQNGLENISQAAVTIQRIQNIRDFRVADETLATYKTDIANSTYGTTDPVTGQRIAGTMETPYMPEGDADGKPTGATIATRKAHAEWMERKDGPYSKLTPRQRELFDAHATEVFRPIDRAAQAADAENYVLRNKQAAEASVQASINLQARSAGDINTTQWAEQNAVGRQAYAHQQTLHLQVDPGNADPAKRKWRLPAGEATYNQKLLEYDEKTAAQRVDTIHQMADAIPVGTEAGDRQAKKLVDFASTFASTFGGEKPILTPEQIAKAKDDGQKVLTARTQRTYAIDVENTRAAEDAADELFLNPDTPAAMSKLMKTVSFLKPEGQARIMKRIRDTTVVNEIKKMRSAFDSYYVADKTDDRFAKAQLDSVIGSLTTDEARAEAKSMLAKSQRDSLRQQDSGQRPLIMARLMAGINRKGEMIREYDRHGAGIDELRAGRITTADHDRYEAYLKTTINEPAVAADVLKAVGRKLNVPQEQMLQDYAYDNDTDQFGFATKTKDGVKSTVVNPEDEIGSATTIIVHDNRPTAAPVNFGIVRKPAKEAPSSKTVKLSAQLVQEVLNAAVAYQLQMKSRTISGTPPEPLDKYLDRFITTSDTYREIGEESIKAHADETHDMIRNIVNRQAIDKVDASIEGMQKRGIIDANTDEQ